ncbi:MAG: hypothetical protein H6734_24630, partial [Alphaproteobacteria bacterium]|nr:hypothetical protein [Alphaproteobacteria bacterium]
MKIERVPPSRPRGPPRMVLTHVLLSAWAAPGPMRDCPLPPDLQRRWDRGTLTEAELPSQLEAWRTAHPDRYGVTEPPPAGTTLVPDFAPMDTLHVALPGWYDHDETYTTLLALASKHGRVRASVMWREDVERIRRRLEGLGARLDRITFEIEHPVDTIWMRDYGPVPVNGPGGPGVLDFGFAPDCTSDDAYPTTSRRP